MELKILNELMLTFGDIEIEQNEFYHNKIPTLF